MSSKQQKDAIVIALDTGKSVSTLHDYEEASFFKQARDCVSWIIQRKIISESKDLLCLLLIGSEDPDNPISTTGYENICVKFDFQLASWDMLKFIETKVKTTQLESDWFGAVIVSLEILNHCEEYNAINNKKIVVFSDFTKQVSDDLNKISKTIKALDIEVTIIGPDHLNSSTESGDKDEPEIKRKKLNKNLRRQEGERIVHELWKKLPENICICTFESALKQLCSYTPKSKRVTYWNCTMDIGDVNINICLFKKTDPKPARKFNTKCIKPSEGDPGQGTSETQRIIEVSMIKSHNTAPTIKDTVMYYKHDTGPNNELTAVEVKLEDTVEGYRYGTTIIPFSKEDKSATEFKSGPKSFSVIGFTHTSNVPYYLLAGECSYLVLPRNKDKNAEVALSALIQGLKKIEFLGIARRVYSDDRGLSLGILYPIVEEIFSDDTDDVSYREYLLFVELAFEDDVKSIAFPSLERVAKDITQQQYNAVDSLIDRMDLMKADKGLRGEPCESFDLPYLHDFKEQFFHHCVIQRGLYPDKPLPSSLPAHIKNFIMIPKLVEENCKRVFEEIKKQFKIKASTDNDGGGEWKRRKTTEPGDGERSKGSSTGGNTEHFSEALIKEDPNPYNRSWMILFAKGFPTHKELDNVFGKYEELNEAEKPKYLESFRHVITKVYGMYLKCNPDEYNQWMRRFKKYLNGEEELGSKIWEIIVSEFVGLITKKVNQYSKVTEEEVEQFFCEDIKSKSTEKEIPVFNFLDELQAEQNNIDFD